MKRLFLCAAAVLSVTAAHATTVGLTDQEMQTVVNALDSYVKTGGLPVAAAAVEVLQKLQAAVASTAAIPSVPDPIQAPPSK